MKSSSVLAGIFSSLPVVWSSAWSARWKLYAACMMLNTEGDLPLELPLLSFPQYLPAYLHKLARTQGAGRADHWLFI